MVASFALSVAARAGEVRTAAEAGSADGAIDGLSPIFPDAGLAAALEVAPSPAAGGVSWPGCGGTTLTGRKATLRVERAWVPGAGG